MVFILFNNENDVGVIVVHVKTLRQTTRFRPQIFPTSVSQKAERYWDIATVGAIGFCTKPQCVSGKPLNFGTQT